MGQIIWSYHIDWCQLTEIINVPTHVAEAWSLPWLEDIGYGGSQLIPRTRIFQIEGIKPVGGVPETSGLLGCWKAAGRGIIQGHLGTASALPPRKTCPCWQWVWLEPRRTLHLNVPYGQPRVSAQALPEWYSQKFPLFSISSSLLVISPQLKNILKTLLSYKQKQEKKDQNKQQKPPMSPNQDP